MSNEFDGVDETNSEMVGTVAVHVTRKEVYKAVRNILANEFKLDADLVKADARKCAEEKAQSEVLSYIKKAGYSNYDLEQKVKFAIDHRLSEFKTILKEVVRELVHKHIRDEVEQVIGTIISDGIKVQIGYPYRTIKVERAQVEKSNGS